MDAFPSWFTNSDTYKTNMSFDVDLSLVDTPGTFRVELSVIFDLYPTMVKYYGDAE